MTPSHHSLHLRDNTYCWRINEALGFPIGDPLRLLAIAVIARWVEDHEKGSADELGEEWVEAAEIPRAWMLEVA